MSAKKDRFSVLVEGERTWPGDYGLDERHCLDVLQGSYDIPWWPERPPIILDIGANVGAFTRWAHARWPGCTIHAFEPEPNNFKLLKKTARALPNSQGIYLNEVAVSDQRGRGVLANWGYNCGEFSFYKMETGRKPTGEVEVEIRAAKDLPSADIIKIDAEGSERAIISGLMDSGKMSSTAALMFEYHNGQEATDLTERLVANGFSIVGQHASAEHRGELQFMRTQLLDQLYPQ